MFKNLLATAILSLATVGSAFAIDVNSATSAELNSIKGIGPVTASQIVKERDANGSYSGPSDLANRIRGIGEKLANRFSAEGLTFGEK